MHHPEYDHAEDRQREPTTVGQPGQPANDVDQRSHDMVSAFGRWGKCDGSKSCNEEQRACKSEIVSWTEECFAAPCRRLAGIAVIARDLVGRAACVS